VGLTSQAAEDAAAAVGLNVDIVDTTITNDQGLRNTVATQTPTAGATVDEGGFVNVTVYTYQPRVPDFAGETVADAQATATNIGLGTINVVNTVITDVQALDGTIESQDPTQGTSVPEGTDVDVDVFVYQAP
jgi:beta-lactam-binding protein with PASTA domain